MFGRHSRLQRVYVWEESGKEGNEANYYDAVSCTSEVLSLYSSLPISVTWLFYVTWPKSVTWCTTEPEHWRQPAREQHYGPEIRYFGHIKRHSGLRRTKMQSVFPETGNKRWSTWRWTQNIESILGMREAWGSVSGHQSRVFWSVSAMDRLHQWTNSS